MIRGFVRLVLLPLRLVLLPIRLVAAAVRLVLLPLRVLRIFRFVGRGLGGRRRLAVG